MAKIKNVSGEDRIVPALGHRLVLAGQVIEVPDDAAESYTCQVPTWEAVKEPKAKSAADSNSREG